MRSLLFIFLAAICMVFIRCSAGKGCPSSGRNVGAEKVLSGDPKTVKAMKRAGKFKS